MGATVSDRYRILLWDHDAPDPDVDHEQLGTSRVGYMSLELARRLLGRADGLTVKQADAAVRRLERSGWSEASICVEREEDLYS